MFNNPLSNPPGNLAQSAKIVAQSVKVLGGAVRTPVRTIFPGGISKPLRKGQKSYMTFTKGPEILQRVPAFKYE